MKILIVGCGRVGARLAIRLQQGDHHVTVVDNAHDAFLRLGGDFGGITIQGSGLELEVLGKAKCPGVDIVFALTGGDNRNLMIAQIAKHQFGVQRAVARLHDPVRAAKFRELGVETVCTTTVLEGLFEIYAQAGAFPELPGEMSVCGDATQLN